MEVHAHTHTARKKWHHYLFEFLMLFLAVFAGFLAENQREHFIEQKREKEYIRSMVEDLSLDSALFSAENAVRETAIMMYDSLIILLNQKNRTAFQQQRIYYFARMSLRLSPFTILNDRTYEQMKSSGNLRLIRKKTISDRITKYYFNLNDLSQNTDQTLLRLQSFLEYHGKIFDGTIFQSMIDIDDFSINPPDGNPPLITEDKNIVNELIVRAHYVLSILLYSKNFMITMKQEALQLIEVLRNGYHLE